MNNCRVYLFTYKRNKLLQRAVQSLINQTYTNWTCELHNDDPIDPFPQKLVESLADERFTIINHSVNLGAVASFNIAFKGCDERYASILEDDNWWEPRFLSEMIDLMDRDDKINVAWSNMRLWEEGLDNNWTDTGRTVWPTVEGTRYFSWPNFRQAMGALHSNGAMIYKSDFAPAYVIPYNSLFNAVELIRERAFEHPLCLNCKPLANFSITLETSRSNNTYLWTGTQIMLLASFIKAAPNAEEVFKNCIDQFRLQKPNPIANIFLANFLDIKKTPWYRYLNFNDWISICRWLVKNGYKIGHLKKYLQSQDELRAYLMEKTLLRYKEHEIENSVNR